MTLELPTLAQFEALPVPERTALFVAWVKAQLPDDVYSYWSPVYCPLAQFGAAIQRIPQCGAGGSTFTASDPAPRDVRVLNTATELGNSLFRAIVRCTTFGQLAQAFDSIPL